MNLDEREEAAAVDSNASAIEASEKSSLARANFHGMDTKKSKTNSFTMNSPANNTAAASALANAAATALLPRKRQANKSPPSAFSPIPANEAAGSDLGINSQEPLIDVYGGNMQQRDSVVGEGSELNIATTPKVAVEASAKDRTTDNTTWKAALGTACSHAKGPWGRGEPEMDDVSCGSCSEDAEDGIFGPRASLHASFELVASPQHERDSPQNIQEYSLSTPITLGKSRSSDFATYPRRFSGERRKDNSRPVFGGFKANQSLTIATASEVAAAIDEASSPSASINSPKRRKGNLFPETLNIPQSSPRPDDKLSRCPASPAFETSDRLRPPPQTVVKSRRKGTQGHCDDTEHATISKSVKSSHRMQQPLYHQDEQLRIAPTPQRSQQHKRCRQSRLKTMLFSPKPISQHKKISGRRLERPPRPSSAKSNVGSESAGEGSAMSESASGNLSRDAIAGREHNIFADGACGTSSPLTSSPMTPAHGSFILENAPIALHNTSSNSNSTGYDSSPATPFRFNAFPASLPRVNPRNTDGQKEREDGTSLFFSSTPFRLDSETSPLNEEEGNASIDASEDQSLVMLGPQRLLLRPKPPTTPIARGIPKSHFTPRNNPQQSSATHKDLFRNIHRNESSNLFAPSFDAAEEGVLSDAVIAPTYSHDLTDVSGDWSEGPSTVNERMPHVPSHGIGPSSSFGGLKLLQEEENEEDTVMESEDDGSGGKENMADGGNGHPVEEAHRKKPPEINFSRTKFNFNPFFSPEIDRAGSELTNDHQQSSKRGHSLIDSHAANLFGSTHPHTPRGLEPFHFHNLEFSQVSPIVRHPDDDEDEVGIEGNFSMREHLDVDSDYKPRRKGEHIEKDPMQPMFCDDDASEGIKTTSSSIPRRNSPELFSRTNDLDTSAASSNTNVSAPNTSANSTSTVNVNNTTAVSRASNATKPSNRKFRPMPDNSAFDICTPSQQSVGSKDVADPLHKNIDQQSTSRLLCPPTPVRTPAWAHSDPSRLNLTRANSLVATKVLAACPPQVLDSLSSLEDSMLENDISGSTLDAETHLALQNSFAPVEARDANSSYNSGVQTFDGKFPADLSPIGKPSKNNDSDDVKSIPKVARKNRFSTEGMADLSSIGSFNSDFHIIRTLGRGAFADVYKVRSKRDNRLYAIKRSHRQFRGVKDRQLAMAEVQTMQRLQSASASSDSSGGHVKNNYGLYLLFFIRAWQEDGYLYCQTELCSRATCRHLRLSLTSEWERDVERFPSLKACTIEIDDPSEGILQPLQRILPERSIWQICHDIARGLNHIHSHGMVHCDIKPSNLFLVFNARFGAICKIGDFGLTGDIGTVEDGQEGDTSYMPNELLSTSAKHPGADIFSFGLTLYELAASSVWVLPREGTRWHDIRSESHSPDLPKNRSDALVNLIKSMLRPKVGERPSSKEITEQPSVAVATASTDSFLSHYVNDVEKYDSEIEREMESAQEEAGRRMSTPVGPILNPNRLSGVNTTSWNIRTPTSRP
ncbi:hypothetical protein ACHAXS_012445 [Conticribra weissflogii]